VAFLAYDQNITYFNLKPTLKMPQMQVITDTENVFLPQPDDLLVNLDESKHLVLQLLDGLPNYFSKTTTPECAFIPALQCANNIIKNVGGKMVFF